ncbi:MAG: VacJ family lipoprotein, partial [Chitinophagaceae bacterium]|nr:VacJ family lipoprotein [Polaromonas sp.]
RAQFLGATDLLDEVALDKYTFTRDLYLKRRANSVGQDLPEKEERYDLPAPAAK